MFSILIVDDNQLDREGIRDLVDWKTLDIRVAGMASNGLDGYNKAIELKPEFVLTDVAMPLMDGIVMTEKIKEQLPDTKFIFMSCFDEFDYVKNAISLDVCEYVLKPIDLEELIKAIGKIKNLKTNEIENMMLQEELKAKVRESLPVLQEQLIRDLIHGRITDVEDMERRMQYLGISYKKSFIIMLIQIDNYDLHYGNVPVEEQYFMIYGVKNHAEETLLKSNDGYLLIQNTSTLCAVIFGDWPDRNEALNDIINCSDKCKENVNEKLGIKITMGISDFSQNLIEISRIFQSAEYAVRSKFYGEGNRIILASEVKQREPIYNYNLGELKQDICDFLISGNREDIMILLDKYCNTEYGDSEIFVKSLYFSITNAVQILLAERNESLEQIFGSEMIIWEKLSKFETIVDIRQWMVNILFTVKEYLDKNNLKRYQSIVSDIKKIIEQNYANISNIEQIVERLYISASHANFIFKQETGKTIFEYLIIVRMEKAKQLLMDPYCKIYEIAESVGYTSKSYFGSIFKEYTGITPKQYRDKFCG